MTGSNKRKGDRAERGAAELLAALTGEPVRRLLGAGRTDDRGDLDLPGWAVQVADWVDVARALRVKPLDADEQAQRAGLPYAAAMLRLRGGEYRVVLTPETFARIYAATSAVQWKPEPIYDPGLLRGLLDNYRNPPPEDDDGIGPG